MLTEEAVSSEINKARKDAFTLATRMFYEVSMLYKQITGDCVKSFPNISQSVYLGSHELR